MPTLDGEEATCAISWRNGKSAETIILVLTALIPTDRDHSTEPGMNATLAKSFTVDRLARAANQTDLPDSNDFEQLMDPAIAKQLYKA